MEDDFIIIPILEGGVPAPHPPLRGGDVHADLGYRPRPAARALLSMASGGVVQPTQGGLPMKYAGV